VKSPAAAAAEKRQWLRRRSTTRNFIGEEKIELAL